MASNAQIFAQIEKKVDFSELGKQLYLQLGKCDKIFAFWDVKQKKVMYSLHEMGEGYVKLAGLDKITVNSVGLDDLTDWREGITSKRKITNLDERMIDYFSYWFEEQKEDLLFNIEENM